LVLETLRVNAERFKPELFDFFRWPMGRILQDSPLLVAERDPAYKVLGNRDENANGEIADLMNELEALAQKTGAALVVAHHFAKGDSTAKSAIDRMSGAGAWSRDPDSIIVLTPHEEENCFTASTILRNLPQVPEFVLQWDYPLMRGGG
jgi:hypothetical protein